MLNTALMDRSGVLQIQFISNFDTAKDVIFICRESRAKLRAHSLRTE